MYAVTRLGRPGGWRPLLALTVTLGIALAILAALSGAVRAAQSELDLRRTVDGIEGLLPAEKQEISAALLEAFGPELRAVGTAPLRPDLLETVASVVSSGRFNEMPAPDMARAAYLAYQAVKEGGPPEYVEELAEVAMVDPTVTPEGLASGARALAELEDSEVPVGVYQEIVGHGLEYGWVGEVILAVARGVKEGVQRGLTPRKLAVAMIVRVDQGLGSVPVAEMIAQETAYVRSLEPGRWRGTPGEPAARTEADPLKEAAYQEMERAVSAGVPGEVAEEIVYHAVEMGWTPELTREALRGLAKGVQEGLPPEKLALAMMVRADQGLGDTSPQVMVEEEIDFVRRMEARRPRPGTPPPGRPSAAAPVRLETGAAMVNASIDGNSLWRSMQSFMNPPPSTEYLWGGESRRPGGTDCSGFTQTCYRDQGLLIPRVSRQQGRTGGEVSRDELRFGDLVFFNKNGRGKITHVGIWVGDDRFAHSCCSKGVTISRLFSNGYFRPRYVGARRMALVSPRG